MDLNFQPQKFYSLKCKLELRRLTKTHCVAIDAIAAALSIPSSVFSTLQAEVNDPGDTYQSFRAVQVPNWMIQAMDEIFEHE